VLPGKTNRRDLHRCAAAAALGFVLISAPARAADQDPVQADRVAVLDAGTFLRVEAHNATLGDVLDQLKAHLKLRVTNTQLLDLSRIVDGSKAGTPLEIVKWLAPGANFFIIYDEPDPWETKPRKLEQIGFLSPGTAVPPTAAEPGLGGQTGTVDAVAVTGSPVPHDGDAMASTSADNRDNELKPVVPSSTPKSEIMGVADQLRAATPEAQLAIEQQAHSSDPQTPLPGFLQSNQDVAQTTLQQQQERSQALAVEQLSALMEAYKAVNRGRALSTGAAQR
jgi:hypothetical protein